jgi:hypothetical protein
MDYLCLPRTIVYLFDVLPIFSDLLLTLFIFAVIDIPMFWLFIVMVDCGITIASDSDPYGLLVISDPSDAILTSLRSFLLIFYLPLPLHTENNIVLRSLTLDSHCILLHSQTLSCIHQPRPTAFYFVLLRSFNYPSFYLAFYQFRFDLIRPFDTYIGLRLQTYPHPYTPLSNHYWSGYPPFLPPSFTSVIARNRYTRPSHLLDHSLVCSVIYFIILVLVWLFSDHTA